MAWNSFINDYQAFAYLRKNKKITIKNTSPEITIGNYNNY